MKFNENIETTEEAKKAQLEKKAEEALALDRHRLEKHFQNGRLLFRDVLNAWLIGLGVREQKPIPIQHYKQYYKGKCELVINNTREQGGEEAADYEKILQQKYLELIMDLSDPEQVKKYDKLVDEYNADLDRIKRENDKDALDKFSERAEALVDEKKK